MTNGSHDLVGGQFLTCEKLWGNHEKSWILTVYWSRVAEVAFVLLEVLAALGMAMSDNQCGPNRNVQTSIYSNDFCSSTITSFTSWISNAMTWRSLDFSSNATSRSKFLKVEYLYLMDWKQNYVLFRHSWFPDDVLERLWWPSATIRSNYLIHTTLWFMTKYL